MTDYRSALDGLIQHDLSELGPEGEMPTPRNVAWLVLDSDHELSYDTGYLVGGDGCPADVWQGIRLRWEIQPATDIEALRSALSDDGELSKLIDRVCSGHTVEWDGSNHVGRLTEAASSADREIEDCLYEMERNELCHWTANEWFGPAWAETRDEVLRRQKDGQSLDMIAETLSAEAERDNALLFHSDVLRCLGEMVEKDEEV